MECTDHPPDHRPRRRDRRVRLLADDRAARSSSRPRPSSSPPAGIGKAYEVTSNSWEYSGDGQALAYDGRAPSSSTWSSSSSTRPGWSGRPGVRGLLVTEAVRGEGGILRNADGERFMWTYLPEERRQRVRRDRRGGGPLGRRPCRQGRETDARRPPELSTRDNVARAIYTEVTRGSRLAARRRLSSTSATCRAEHVRRKLPSMYEQFKELADVDITKRPDGGRSHDPLRHGRHPGRCRDRRDDGRPGSSPPARSPAGMHGANRLGGNSLSDLLVFGARTGTAAAADRPPAGPASRTSIRSRSRRPRARAGRAARAGRRRGPVRHPARPADDDAAAGRHLPGRGRPRRGDRRAGRAAPPLANVRVTRRARLQPRLEPRLRARQPADRVGGDRPQRPPADREPRRAQPARLPRDRRRDVGRRQQRRRRGCRWHDDGRRPRRSRRCPTSCAACSAATTDDGGIDAGRTPEGLPRRAPARKGTTTSSTCRSRRGWSSSTPCTGSRATRRPISPCAGTARPPSAARAAPRSTAGRA